MNTDNSLTAQLAWFAIWYADEFDASLAKREIHHSNLTPIYKGEQITLAFTGLILHEKLSDIMVDEFEARLDEMQRTVDGITDELDSE